MNAKTGRLNLIMAFLTTGASIARADPVKADWPVGGCLDSAIASFIGTFGISRAFNRFEGLSIPELQDDRIRVSPCPGLH